MASPTPKSQHQQREISSLPLSQLTSLKNQLTQDLQHLTSSFQQLRGAQIKFKDCIASIKGGVQNAREGKEILAPLTTSLYVPARMASTNTVLVDIGTGFYVEKNPAAATDFYSKKAEELGKSLGELEGIVGQKSGQLRVVEDTLRQKVISENSGGNAGESTSSGAPAG